MEDGNWIFIRDYPIGTGVIQQNSRLTLYEGIFMLDGLMVPRQWYGELLELIRKDDGKYIRNATQFY